MNFPYHELGAVKKMISSSLSFFLKGARLSLVGVALVVLDAPDFVEEVGATCLTPFIELGEAPLLFLVVLRTLLVI